MRVFKGLELSVLKLKDSILLSLGFHEYGFFAWKEAEAYLFLTLLIRMGLAKAALIFLPFYMINIIWDFLVYTLAIDFCSLKWCFNKSYFYPLKKKKERKLNLKVSLGGSLIFIWNLVVESWAYHLVSVLLCCQQPYPYPFQSNPTTRPKETLLVQRRGTFIGCQILVLHGYQLRSSLFLFEAFMSLSSPWNVINLSKL